MHDIKAIRENSAAYDRHWSAKGRSGAADEAVRLDAELRAAQTTLQEAQAKRNESSKLIGMAKAKKDEAEAQRLMAEVESLKGVMAAAAEAESVAGGKLKDLLASLPNIPAPEVPAGEDEHGNVEQRRWGDAQLRDAEAPQDVLRVMDLDADALDLDAETRSMVFGS